MPRLNVVVETPIIDSFRVAAMRGMFDVPPERKLRHEWDVNIPIEDLKWNVGLIVGSSGSGKTTIAKQMWGEEKIHRGFMWDHDRSILDSFPQAMDVKEILTLLGHVGFNSPPSWAKPFHVLSNGQAFRVELARLLSEKKEFVIVDEFTSVIDRNAAQVGSFALQKTARRLGKQIIALSCHRDIIEWLEPDWVYDTDAQEFKRGSLQRPSIDLEIFETDRQAWRLFGPHHYLTGALAPAAQCFVAYWKGDPIAFTSYVQSVGFAGVKREHRTVVLPDFQGIGAGVKLTEWLFDRLMKKGFRITSTFSHPALVHARLKSKKWILLGHGHQAPSSERGMTGANSSRRLTARMEYVGTPKVGPPAKRARIASGERLFQNRSMFGPRSKRRS